MHDDILKLALDLSRTTGEKIGSIDKIMVKTQILAMNARLEAARAGHAGKSFAVVAQEMRHVTDEVSALSKELHSAISENATRIEAAGRQMAMDFRGKRFADMARNAVEIIDRNLYERSCDVRWWATDSAVVDAVQTPSPHAHAHASDRLATILRSYTVYLDLWIADASGRVIASGRPDRYPAAKTLSVADAAWFKDALRTRSGDDFTVCDIERVKALNDAPVATYATAIRVGGQANGKVIGVLGVHFDWKPQAQAIVDGVRLTEDERARSRVMLLDQNHRVLASSDGKGVLEETFKLDTTGGAMGSYAEGARTVGYALTPGYETYRGLGWYGCLVQTAEAEKSATTFRPALSAGKAA